MPADRDFDTDASVVDLPWPGNLRTAPQPISSDPRLDPKHMQGHPHVFTTNGSQQYNGMTLTAIATDGKKAPEHEPTRMLQCCCGRRDCTFLTQNNNALGEVERDLETAARLGQALLTRHESYINESQAEQTRLIISITRLEEERTSLQDANQRIVAENRDLLQRLQDLNGNLADSDQHVKRLEQLLQDCELEVKRLTGVARRAQELDSRVQELEVERQTLSQQVDEGRDENRSTLARWRESEQKVQQLEEDLHRIEWEAQVDRERHERIVARLEKERDLEREGATLPNLSADPGESKSVVSHFVRDILQDNANLQAGIAELRQLLQLSNEEVQGLRDQIINHQPVESTTIATEVEPQRQLSLDQEIHLGSPSSPKPQQEVHVHHHYHSKSIKSRHPTARRSNRRRIIIPGQGSISDTSVPSTPISRTRQRSSISGLPPSVQHSQMQKNNRWSVQSTATMSSVLSSFPSSPRSYFDRGYFYDRIERGEESSRPTSPESMADAVSPGPGQWRFRDTKRNSLLCEEVRELSEPLECAPMVESESKPCFDANDLPTPMDSPAVDETQETDKELTPKPSIMLLPQSVEADDDLTGPGPEFNEEEVCVVDVVSEVPIPPSVPLLDKLIIPDVRPSLNRKGSHETLVSISGMDIHIAQRASPAATLELLHRHFAHSPSQVRKVSAVQPLASVTEYTVVSSPVSIALNQYASRPQLRDMPSSVDMLNEIATVKPKPVRAATQTGTIGRIGGWVRGKWGMAPTKTIVNQRAASYGPSTTNPTSPSRLATVLEADGVSTSSIPIKTAAQQIPIRQNSVPSSLHAKVDPAILFSGRSPGVNQRGSIPGFRAAVMSKRTPSQVMASVIDEEGLREGLAE